MSSSLQIIPLHLRDANELVRQWHRHHRPVAGAKFAIGISDGSKVVGAAIVGRPVSRMLDDEETLEVTRLVTDGTKNACSALYAAAWRAARAMGYCKLITYILAEESGVSLKAAGWKTVGQAGGGSWNRTTRPRVDRHPTQGKIRYEVQVGAEPETTSVTDSENTKQDSKLAASPELLPTQLDPISKHPLTPEPQSTQLDTGKEK